MRAGTIRGFRRFPNSALALGCIDRCENELLATESDLQRNVIGLLAGPLQDHRARGKDDPILRHHIGSPLGQKWLRTAPEEVRAASAQFRVDRSDTRGGQESGAPFPGTGHEFAQAAQLGDRDRDLIGVF